MHRVATILGNQQMKKDAQRFDKMNKRVALVESLFRYFVENEWCFESKRCVDIMEEMTEDERTEFRCNPKAIDWKVASFMNLYGIQKHVFRMDVCMPFQEQNKLISRVNVRYFEDI